MGIYQLQVNDKNTKLRCENMFKVHNKDTTRLSNDVIVVSLMLTLNRFHLFF